MGRIDAGAKKSMDFGGEEKDILESECVCDCHFVAGKAAATWDKHNIGWVLTLNLGKRDYKGNEQKEQNQKAAEERAETAKEGRKRSTERQEVEVVEKRKHLNVSGDRGVDIHFTETSTSTSTEEVEEDPGIANATEMEPSEASNSTTGTKSDDENHAEGSISEPSKDAETQTEEFEV